LETTGVRRQGDSKPAVASDLFYLWSNGKAITATVAGLLVEQGTILRNTIIAQEFQNLGTRMNAAYRNVPWKICPTTEVGSPTRCSKTLV
jgi:hypothetical protein